MNSASKTSVRPTATGYLHSLYAQSLSEFGTLRPLHRSGSWVLRRQIPGTSFFDGLGCYPLFCCKNWSALAADLEDSSEELVSIVAVTDPFGEYDEGLLKTAFRDVVRPYKSHFIADLREPLETIPSRHHRYYARRSRKKGVNVEVCEKPLQFLDEWTLLYDLLVERHQITGIQAFSRKAFEHQLRIPGLTMFRALLGSKTVSAHLWLSHGDAVFSHLAATTDEGYAVSAPYALYWEALHHFGDERRWIDFGGAAGLNSDGTDGLTAFKRGWATGTKSTYLCGRVLNNEAYEQLSAGYNVANTYYFPLYRKPGSGDNTKCSLGKERE